MIRTPAAAFLVLALSGSYHSLSGVGGTERYACKAPEGALCTSVSGVYANSVQGAFRPAERQLPARVVRTEPVAYGADATCTRTTRQLRTRFGRRSRLRSNPRLLRPGSPRGKTRTAICTNRHLPSMFSSRAAAG